MQGGGKSGGKSGREPGAKARGQAGREVSLQEERGGIVEGRSGGPEASVAGGETFPPCAPRPPRSSHRVWLPQACGGKATSKAGPFSEAGTEADDEAARYGAVVQAGSEATGDGNHLAMALESLVTKASYH